MQTTVLISILLEKPCTNSKKIEMKKIMILLSTGFLLVGCSKNPNVGEASQQDSVLTHDSMVEGLRPYSPDNDSVPTVNPSAYDTDSIKKSR